MLIAIIIAGCLGVVAAIIIRQKVDTAFAEDIARARGLRKNKDEHKKDGISSSLRKLSTNSVSAKSAENYRVLLEKANLDITPGTWVAICIATALCGAGLLLLFAISSGVGAGIFIPAIALGAGIGWFICRLWLRKRIDTYREDVERTLPSAIELLAIVVSSGEPLQSGIRTVVECEEDIGAAATEFARVIREIDFAGESFENAMLHMSERMESQQVGSFVSSVVQGSRGASVKDILKQQAEDSRAIMRDKVKEQIAKIGVKMTVPMTLFFLPAVLLFILLPTVSQLLSFLGGM